MQEPGHFIGDVNQIDRSIKKNPEVNIAFGVDLPCDLRPEKEYYL
jgi:hypothetical protein